MYAAAAKIDITPEGPVWMDGMLRAHRSEGVHDPLYVRALVLSPSTNPAEAVAFVSIDVCALKTEVTEPARQAAAAAGIPAERVILHATHTHSGPAALGYFNPREEEWVARMVAAVGEAVGQALASLKPARLGLASGSEGTIMFYRRLLADDGHVVMNWEPYPPEKLVGPLGEVDPEVGVLRVVAADNGATVATLFNHAGHPNVLSGDSYIISAEYPGVAEAAVEAACGGLALFFNGAQGTMDIDGLRDRDLEGMDRIGGLLGQAVVETAKTIDPVDSLPLQVLVDRYSVPARKITAEEWSWAQAILEQTGGKIEFLADGVGDDYVAVLYRDLRAREDQPIPVEQTCVALGDSAFLTFPGEMYTETGLEIKARSPFARTYIIGLSNGHIGYVPPAKAIAEGGYAEVTRQTDVTAEAIIVERSLALLEQAHAKNVQPQE
ncbi:MAG: neutral/alkaline non-lysosomal ceramidase N-terminal domain-containing protein [Armatimonadetes bacterium]|nr:neutral/alkaline non-lysosomal ceramidase N-terminal domain-containing protein [Armatimonadota bacterium]